MKKQIHTPLTREAVKNLHAGDLVSVSGIIYTARDSAHKRMLEDYTRNGVLPFDIRDQIIYYCGPAPAKPGAVIGSAGPTTSSRMDKYAPELIRRGMTGMIGKGYRNEQVIEAMQQYGAVYIGATGGAGALIAQAVTHSEVLAYPNLGAEAVYKLTVKELPGIVIIDCYGNNLYKRKE